jgi:hypothetical protein
MNNSMPEQTLSPLHAMVLGLVMIDAERARRGTDERKDESVGEYIDRRQAAGEI